MKPPKAPKIDHVLLDVPDSDDQKPITTVNGDPLTFMIPVIYQDEDSDDGEIVIAPSQSQVNTLKIPFACPSTVFGESKNRNQYRTIGGFYACQN